MLKRALKLSLFATARRLGLFSLARHRTGDCLTILCYHGFVLEDEDRYDPTMFVRAETLRSRLELLRRRGYEVIGLDQAVRTWQEGTLKPNQLAITTDDGFHSFAAIAVPLLEEYGHPHALYLTSYYAEHATPVYNYLLLNMFRRSRAESVDLSEVHPTLPILRLDGDDETPVVAAIRDIERLFSHAQMEAVCVHIGDLIGIDYEPLRDKRLYSLVTAAEAEELAERGVDLQLHTHRHRFPVDAEVVHYEIERNREALRALGGHDLKHFCYPSGNWHPDHLPLLRALGVASATTCDPGLNRPGRDPLTLRRVLDAESVAELDFEAEVSGFKGLLREALARLRGRSRDPSPA